MTAKNRLSALFSTLSFAFVFTLTCSSCVVHRTTTGTIKIDKGIVERVIRGKTSRSEISQWFGPPLIIAHYGSHIIVPNTTISYTNYSIALPATAGPTPGSLSIQTDTFFELFQVRDRESEYDILYYESTTGKTSGAWVMFFETQDTKILQDRLWVLVRKGNGIVEDYVFQQIE